MGEELFEDPEFRRSDRTRLSLYFRLCPEQVEPQESVIKHSPLFFPAPLQDDADLPEQDLHGEWLCHIVLRAHFIPQQGVLLQVPCRQEEHRDFGALPDPAAEYKALPVRQVHIQQDQIRAVLFIGIPPFRDSVGGYGAIALFLQDIGNPLVHLPVVFHY